MHRQGLTLAEVHDGVHVSPLVRDAAAKGAHGQQQLHQTLFGPCAICPDKVCGMGRRGSCRDCIAVPRWLRHIQSFPKQCAVCVCRCGSKPGEVEGVQVVSIVTALSKRDCQAVRPKSQANPSTSCYKYKAAKQATWQAGALLSGTSWCDMFQASMPFACMGLQLLDCDNVHTCLYSMEHGWTIVMTAIPYSCA